MSIWNISGCEPGLNSYAVVGSNGTYSADTTVKRTGAYSYKVAAVAGLGGNFKLAGWSASTGLPANLTSGGEIYITYYVRRTAQTTNGKKHIALDGNAADNAAYLWLNTDGTLSIYDANGVNQGTTTTSIPLNAWARIEWRVLMGSGANGTSTLRLYQDDANGSTPETLSLTGKDFQSGASTYFKLVQFSAQETTGDIYYDDIVIADDAFYPGKVELMIPSADGTDTGFESYVGSADYTSLDDVPGSVSDALRSPLATAAAETPAMESCASAGISGTINAVLCLCYADADSTAINVKLRYRSGGVVDSADFSVSTTEGYKGVLSTTKPAGGAWDTTALDALEVGLVDNDATRRVIFGAAHAEVHFTEAAASTFTATGALTAAGAAAAGTGTHVAPTFAASGALAPGGAAGAGTATHVAPTFSASGSLAPAGAAAAATGTHTAPTFSGAAALTAGGAAAAGAALFATAVFSATGALVAGGPASAGAGTHVPPTFSGTGAAAVGGAAAAGAATAAGPLFSATGAMTAGGAATASVGTYAAGTFTATGTATVAGAAASVVGAVTNPTVPQPQALRLAAQGGLRLAAQGGLRLAEQGGIRLGGQA